MSVAISTLTSSDAVRSALGLEERDLADAFFTAHDLGPELLAELATWFATWDTFDEDVDGGPLLKAYAKYWVAWTVSTAHATYTAAGISDGQNELSRFPEHKSKELEQSLKKKWLRYRSLLVSLYPDDALNNAPARSIFGGAAPDYDPVTNETT